MVSSLCGLVVCILATVVWSQRSPIRVAMVHEDDVEQIKAIVMAHAGEDTGTDEYKTKVQVNPIKYCLPYLVSILWYTSVKRLFPTID